MDGHRQRRRDFGGSYISSRSAKLNQSFPRAYFRECSKRLPTAACLSLPTLRGEAPSRRLSALRDKRLKKMSGWVIRSSSRCVMAQTGDNGIQLSAKSLHFFWEVGAILGKMPDIIRNGTQPLAQLPMIRYAGLIIIPIQRHKPLRALSQRRKSSTERLKRTKAWICSIPEKKNLRYRNCQGFPSNHVILQPARLQASQKRHRL